MEAKLSIEENVQSRFTTTRWSLILSSTSDEGDESKSREALAQLCQIYWRPIFAFICRRGHSPADAQDLTQDFFVMILEGTLLRRADPTRGRFRSLLLKALQNFLIDAHEKRRAIKRGGTMSFISWDDWMAEAPSQLNLPSQALESWPAERLFDVRWAATVVERSLHRLREECEMRGRRRVFDTLSGSLSGTRTEISYEELGQRLGVDQTAVKRLIYRLRQRYRILLREEVGRTVEKPEEVEEELRYLCSVLAANEGG